MEIPKYTSQNPNWAQLNHCNGENSIYEEDAEGNIHTSWATLTANQCKNTKKKMPIQHKTQKAHMGAHLHLRLLWKDKHTATTDKNILYN